MYQVIGPRAYRGHEPGTVFEARLDRPSESRAINRGSIRLLELVEADLLPGSYRLPLGWPTTAREEVR